MTKHSSVPFRTLYVCIPQTTQTLLNSQVSFGRTIQKPSCRARTEKTIFFSHQGLCKSATNYTIEEPRPICLPAISVHLCTTRWSSPKNTYCKKQSCNSCSPAVAVAVKTVGEAIGAGGKSVATLSTPTLSHCLRLLEGPPSGASLRAGAREALA